MTSWSPQLENPPAIAHVLLNGLRRAIPALFDAAQRAPGQPTRPIPASLVVSDDPAAGLVVAGRNLQRDNFGARDALYLDFSGEAKIRGTAVPVEGDVVLDLATGAILRLRLRQPVAV